MKCSLLVIILQNSSYQQQIINLISF